MKTKAVLGMLISLALGAAAQGEDIQYKVINVLTKGWVKGRVSHANKDLHVPRLEGNRDVEVCGKGDKQLEAIDLGPGGELRNVVVYLKDITAGKEFPIPSEAPVVTQKKCQFIPHVQVVPPFSSIRILNEDNILHGVHAFQNDLGTKFVLFPHSVVYPARTLFNICLVAERK
jgi:hypothetical protein